MSDYDCDGTYWPTLDSDIKKDYFLLPTDTIRRCTIQQIEYSDWQCHVSANFVLVPLKGKEPNWFHRKMQTLCFGFKWSKK